jgi:SAM-dependent methyltransferase
MSRSNSLLDKLLIPKGSRVVDVGFGSSKELLALSSIVGEAGVVSGIERSKGLVKKVEAELGVANVHIFVGDAVQIPLPENSVDTILFKGVFHEVKDIEQALLQAERVCDKSGRIVIVDFSSFPKAWLKLSNFRWRLGHPWRILGPPPDLHAGFGQEEIRSFLEKAGLRLERYEDSVAQGRFYGHPVPMFLATSIVYKQHEPARDD